jgi:glycosyltransferase involved in cell wall biosynthesis
MDRHLSPRIAYWTSAFEPEMEAVAAEVAELRRRFPSSVVWGLSHRRRALVSLRRWQFCLNPRLQLLFRAATRLFEPLFQLNHVFGSLGDWFYLQGVRQRPTVLTMATFAEPVRGSLLDRVDRFVVEYPGGEAYLRQLGIDSQRVRLILPPVDLERFRPTGRHEGPFTVLFASSPERAAWLAGRGIPAILDAAALRPRMRFRLLWRPWGDSLPPLRRWIAERQLVNVELIVGRYPHMGLQYQAAHATVAPFTQPEQYKPAPNSLLESLACGRPVVTTPDVGLAEVIRDEGSGIVTPPDGASLAEGLDQLQADWPTFSRNARQLAERRFGVERFLDAYELLYRELISWQ